MMRYKPIRQRVITKVHRAVAGIIEQISKNRKMEPLSKRKKATANGGKDE